MMKSDKNWSKMRTLSVVILCRREVQERSLLILKTGWCTKLPDCTKLGGWTLWHDSYIGTNCRHMLQGGHKFLAIKFPDFSLIWFSLIKNLNIIAMAPTFRSHTLIQMLSSDMFIHNAVTICEFPSCKWSQQKHEPNTPQPRYNTVGGSQTTNRVS